MKKFLFQLTAIAMLAAQIFAVPLSAGAAAAGANPAQGVQQMQAVFGQLIGRFGGKAGQSVAQLNSLASNVATQLLSGNANALGLISSSLGGVPSIIGSLGGLGGALGGLGGAAGGLGGGGGGGGGEVPVKDAVVRQQTTIIAKQTTDLRNKEYILNKLAKQVAQRVEQQATAATVNYANTGRGGNPYFVQNPAQYMQSIRDGVAQNFVLGGLDGLSPAVRQSVQLALANNENATIRSGLKSTITQQQYNNLMQGKGNMNDFFTYFSNPNNNQTGAYLNAQEALTRLVNEDQQAKADQINQGNGFLPQETCKVVGFDDFCLDPQVQTPGIIIQQGVGDAISKTQYDGLINSEDIGGVVSSLGYQIFNNIFGSSGQGGNGLLGLNIPSLSGAASFIARLGSEAAGGGGSGGGGGATGSSTAATKEDAIAQITAKLAELSQSNFAVSKQNSLGQLDIGEKALKDVIACYAAKETHPLYPSDKSAADAGIAAASSTIATTITPLRATVGDSISTLISAATYISAIGLAIQDAKTVAQVSALFSEYQRFIQTVNLDSNAADAEFIAINAQVNSIVDQSAKDMKSCEAIIPTDQLYSPGYTNENR